MSLFSGLFATILCPRGPTCTYTGCPYSHAHAKEHAGGAAKDVVAVEPPKPASPVKEAQPFLAETGDAPESWHATKNESPKGSNQGKKRSPNEMDSAPQSAASEPATKKKKKTPTEKHEKSSASDSGSAGPKKTPASQANGKSQKTKTPKPKSNPIPPQYLVTPTIPAVALLKLACKVPRETRQRTLTKFWQEFHRIYLDNVLPHMPNLAHEHALKQEHPLSLLYSTIASAYTASATSILAQLRRRPISTGLDDVGLAGEYVERLAKETAEGSAKMKGDAGKEPASRNGGAATSGKELGPDGLPLTLVPPPAPAPKPPPRISLSSLEPFLLPHEKYAEYGYPPPPAVLEQWREKRREGGEGASAGGGTGAAEDDSSAITGPLRKKAKKETKRRTCERCSKKFVAADGVFVFHPEPTSTAHSDPAQVTKHKTPAASTPSDEELDSDNSQPVCTYHPTRATFQTGPAIDPTRVFRCCSRPLTDPGCCVGVEHVWKEESWEGMEETEQEMVGGGNGVPFASWPGLAGGSGGNGWAEAGREDGAGEKEKGAMYPVLALDCEMVYTTLGMECGRVVVLAPEIVPDSVADGSDTGGTDGGSPAAVKPPTPATAPAPSPGMRIVLDTFVLPRERLIDANTQYSGLKWSTFLPAHPSLAAARDALFALMDETTVLVGHGLDNDLRALRVVHGRCVDTAHVFPNRRGMPVRNGLRFLAQRLLGREIQGGARVFRGTSAAQGSTVPKGAANEKEKEAGKSGEPELGHDPREDAEAAWELVVWRAEQKDQKRRWVV